MNQALPQRVKIAYFGKVKSCADFIKNNVNSLLMNRLDKWTTAALVTLQKLPDWEKPYDAMPPLFFLTFAPQGQSAIGGCITASQDSTGRRFPFLCATSFEALPLSPLAIHAPMMFRPIWDEMEASYCTLVESQEPVFDQIDSENSIAEIYPTADQELNAFLENSSLSDIEALLQQAGHEIDLHDSIIALGELLSPMLKNNRGVVQRGLLLPMPQPVAEACLIASFWMKLISHFLTNSDCELTLYFGNILDKPHLAVGFLGLNSDELASLFSSPNNINAHFICLDQAPWAHQIIATKSVLFELSQCLSQSNLPISKLCKNFEQAYYGAQSCEL